MTGRICKTTIEIKKEVIIPLGLTPLLWDEMAASLTLTCLKREEVRFPKIFGNKRQLITRAQGVVPGDQLSLITQVSVRPDQPLWQNKRSCRCSARDRSYMDMYPASAFSRIGIWWTSKAETKKSPSARLHGLRTHLHNDCVQKGWVFIALLKNNRGSRYGACSHIHCWT